MAAGGHGTKAVVAAMFANLGIAIAKFVGFLVTRSSALLAEALHSVADTGNQALLLLGGRRARRAATTTHPFGYGRERYFWSFVVAIVLFTLGSAFSLYEGVQKLRGDEHGLESPLVAVVILLVGIVLETASFRVAIKEADQIRGEHGWWEFVRRSKTPELPVVLLEDLGALVGLVLALAGVSVAALTGDSAWDAYATLAIGALLGVIAAVLAAETRSLLLGEAASPSHIATIRRIVTAAPHVRRLLHLQTQHLGPDELLVAAKVELDPELTFPDVVKAIDQAEARLRAALPIARVIYLEPDVYADEGEELAPAGPTEA